MNKLINCDNDPKDSRVRVQYDRDIYESFMEYMLHIYIYIYVYPVQSALDDTMPCVTCKILSPILGNQIAPPILPTWFEGATVQQVKFAHVAAVPGVVSLGCRIAFVPCPPPWGDIGIGYIIYEYELKHSINLNFI